MVKDLADYHHALSTNPTWIQFIFVCVQCVIWDYFLLVARLRLSVWRVVYVCIWLCVCKCRSYSESSIYASAIRVCLCVCLCVNVCYQGNSPSLNKPFVCFGCSLLWACCPPGCSLSALFESLIKALPLSPLAPILSITFCISFLVSICSLFLSGCCICICCSLLNCMLYMLSWIYLHYFLF